MLVNFLEIHTMPWFLGNNTYIFSLWQ